MVDEVKPLLTYTRNSGDQREVFETDLNDETKPIVADIQSILNTKASLDEAYQKGPQNRVYHRSGSRQSKTTGCN